MPVDAELAWLAMTTLTSDSTVDIQARRYGWPAALALHLAPAAATFAATLALAPVLARHGLPPSFALTLAFGLVLMPIELGLLLWNARRQTGHWRIGPILAFHGRLGRRAWLIPPLFALALVVAVAYSPVAGVLGPRLVGIYPNWLLPSYDVNHAGYPHVVMLTTTLVTLLIDGIANPTVEELYFRAYLLPRLPVRGVAAVVVSSALFTTQHYWQPYNWPLILVLELILTAVVVRLRRYRIGIALHVLANSVGILLGLLG
jgi:membrane protease YdiL (CAAX protease family)